MNIINEKFTFYFILALNLLVFINNFIIVKI